MEFSARLVKEGFNQSITGQEGSYQITRVISGFNEDETPTVENNVKVVSFNVEGVHNAGYKDGIVKGVDDKAMLSIGAKAKSLGSGRLR